jgi:hypothetical protein
MDDMLGSLTAHGQGLVACMSCTSDLDAGLNLILAEGRVPLEDMFHEKDVLPFMSRFNKTCFRFDVCLRLRRLM